MSLGKTDNINPLLVLLACAYSDGHVLGACGELGSVSRNHGTAPSNYASSVNNIYPACAARCDFVRDPSSHTLTLWKGGLFD